MIFKKKNMDFSKLNSVGRCETPLSKTIKAGDLEIGGVYRLTDIRLVETRYGPSWVVQLHGKGDLFLPKRFGREITPETAQGLLAAKATLKLLGFKVVGSIITPLYEFSPGESSA